MLHGLAGFIFGKSPSSDADAVPAGRENRGTNADDAQNAISPSTLKSDSLEIVGEDDEEWLMVDVRREKRTPPDSATALPTTVELDLVLPLSVEASSGESSPSVDERGWNLTPPPCFTASFQREKRRDGAALSTGDKACNVVGAETKTVGCHPGGDDNEAVNAVLETSNFENLLIEHPSMSVYGRIAPYDPPRRRNVAAAIALAQEMDQSRKVITVALPTPQPNPEGTAAVVRRGRHAASVAEVLLGADLRMVASRRSDLEKQQRDERLGKMKELGANRARRMNAVAVHPPRVGASPRKRRAKNHPAGRCNDRKCQ